LNRLSDVTPRNDADSDPDWGPMHRDRVLSFALETVRKRSRRRTWDCFDRHVLQRRPSAEVASELGLTVNNVDVNSSRILDRVRKLCAEYLEELADGVDVLPAEPSAGP
jgi:hypothetical protein